MSDRMRGASWWVLVVAIAMTSTAYGQDARQRAGDAFQAAVAHFDAGEMDDALHQFRVAYELMPHASVRVNIGMCLVELGRYREAYDEFEAALDGGTLAGEQAEHARELSRLARARLGTLRITGRPEGATVSIDGVDRCVVPCETLVDPRSHVITVREGEREANATIVATAGGEVSVDMTLQTPLVADAPPDPAVGLEEGADGLAVALGEPAAEPSGLIDRSQRFQPEWLTWAGGALCFAAATSGTGLRLRARNLHDELQDRGELGATQAEADFGDRLQRGAWALWGVAVVGASLVLLDYLLSLQERNE